LSSSSRFDEAAGYGGGWVVPVAERLLDSSTSFAQSSIAAYVAESWEVFHLHLATAIEQLAKAALADKHPTLLADPRGDFDSLLHLSGLGHFAQKPEYLIRTITASEAIQRLGRVVDDYRAPGRRVALRAMASFIWVTSRRLKRKPSSAKLPSMSAACSPTSV
jgi:hypothetical protein